MYAASSKTCNVNLLRHELFLSKRGENDSSTLPHVRTVSSSTYNVPITRLGCGGELYSKRLMFRKLTAMDGSGELMVPVRLDGYMARSLLMLFSSFLHAKSRGNVYQWTVLV